MECHNICQGFDFAQVEKLVNGVKRRFAKIQENTNVLLKNTDAITVIKEEELCE
jgi:hypothetical protein